MSNSINELLGKATWRDFIYALHDDPCWSWIDPFWPWGFVLGETDDKKRFPVFKWKSQEIVPATLRRLGCSTTIEKDHPNGGELAYLLWDFDVCKGNPADAYNTPQEALDAALSLRTALGLGEVRVSSGGNGYALRMRLPARSRLSVANGSIIIRGINLKLNLRCDKSVVGRQVSFLWSRDLTPSTLGLVPHELVQAHGDVGEEASDLVLWALSNPLPVARNGHAPAAPTGLTIGTVQAPPLARRDLSLKSKQRVGLGEVYLKSLDPADLRGRQSNGCRNFHDFGHLAWDLGIDVHDSLVLMQANGINIPSLADAQRWLEHHQGDRFQRGWRAAYMAKQDGIGTREQKRAAFKQALSDVCATDIESRDAVVKAASDQGVVSDLWINITTETIDRYREEFYHRWNGFPIQEDRLMTSWLLDVHCSVFGERSGLGRSGRDAYIAILKEIFRIRGCLPCSGHKSGPVRIPVGLVAPNKMTGRKALKRLELSGLVELVEKSREHAARYTLWVPKDEDRDRLEQRCQLIATCLRGQKSYASKLLAGIRNQISESAARCSGGEANGIIPNILQRPTNPLLIGANAVSTPTPQGPETKPDSDELLGL